MAVRSPHCCRLVAFEAGEGTEVGRPIAAGCGVAAGCESEVEAGAPSCCGSGLAGDGDGCPLLRRRVQVLAGKVVPLWNADPDGRALRVPCPRGRPAPPHSPPRVRRAERWAGRARHRRALSCHERPRSQRPGRPAAPDDRADRPPAPPLIPPGSSRGIGAGNHPLGQANNLPQCTVTHPNATTHPPQQCPAAEKLPHCLPQ